MRTLAFSRSGNVTSTSLPLTTAATAAFASRGEICAATSPGVDPADTRRLEPSGSVTEISDIRKLHYGRRSEVPFDPSTRPLRGLAQGELRETILKTAACHERTTTTPTWPAMSERSTR